MIRDEGLPAHGEDVSVGLPEPGHRVVVQIVHLAAAWSQQIISQGFSNPRIRGSAFD